MKARRRVCYLLLSAAAMTLLVPGLSRASRPAEGLKPVRPIGVRPVGVPFRDLLRTGSESTQFPALFAVQLVLKMETVQAHVPPALEFSVELRTSSRPVALTR